MEKSAKPNVGRVHTLDASIRKALIKEIGCLGKGFPDYAAVSLELPAGYLRRLGEILTAHEDVLDSLAEASADYHEVMDLIGVESIADVPELLARKNSEIARQRKIAGAAGASPADADEVVEELWFTDRSLPVMAIYGDAANRSIISLLYRRAVGEADCEEVAKALEIWNSTAGGPHLLCVTTDPDDDSVLDLHFSHPVTNSHRDSVIGALNLGSLQAAGEPCGSDSRSVRLSYRNWRGEVSGRTITPLRLWYGSTQWHPEDQWLLTAYDHEKLASRDFALRDFLGESREGDDAGTEPEALQWEEVSETEFRATAGRETYVMSFTKVCGWQLRVGNRTRGRFSTFEDARLAAEAAHREQR